MKKIKVTVYRLSTYKFQYRYWNEDGSFIGMCETLLGTNKKWYPA